MKNIMKRSNPHTTHVTGSHTGRNPVCIETADIVIYADPMLEKVFYNLVENALRHGHHVTRIRFSTEISDTEARIICEDNGCGVPEQFKEDIFVRKHFKKTGFNLFLARDILTITGFSIRETGVPGTGARFEITIPRAISRPGTHSTGCRSERAMPPGGFLLHRCLQQTTYRREFL